MLFSIIVPIYNVDLYLSRCLDSLSAQDFSDFEVVLVNDGSTDGSECMARQWVAAHPESSITLLVQPNQGLSAARNAGLSAAKGDYVLFLDSDDWLIDTALSIIASYINSEDMLCFAGQRYIESIKTYQKVDALDPEKEISGWDYYSRHALEHRDFAFVCAVLRCYRRQFLLDHGLWFRTGIYHEDNLFTPLACYHARRVSVIPQTLYIYRVRSNSIMTTRSLKHNQDMIRIANELAGFFIDKTDVDKVTLYQALTNYYQSAFYNSPRCETAALSPLVDWKLYYAVSRTKLRHRINYLALRLSPSIYKTINKQKN